VGDPVIEVRQPGRRPLHLVVVDRLEIGRACDGLVVADSEASRRQAEVFVSRSGLRAQDLGSTNGTFLNGRQISGDVALEPGDVLTFGAVQIGVWAGGPSLVASAGDQVTSIERVAATVDGHTADVAGLRGDGDTVTIVFSDIERSTEQAVALGDARWFSVLGAHNGIVRDRLSQFGGTEIKAQGDGFMLTFPSARRAVQFAVDVQQGLEAHDWDSDEGVRVRIGMHTGEAIVDDDGDLFGRHIIVAARVANEAEGGEILVSPVVREIVAGREDITFDEPRRVKLKGITDDYEVHPVLW
jgi:adenylate cyclase